MVREEIIKIIEEELITSAEALKILDISKQRLSKLPISPILTGYYLKMDVLDYKEVQSQQRKRYGVGPKKNE